MMFAGTVVSYGRRIAIAAMLVGAQVTPAQDLNPRGSLTGSLALGGPAVGGGLNNSYPFSVASKVDYFTSRANFPSPFFIVALTSQLLSGNTLIESGVDRIPIRSQMPNSFLVGVLGLGGSRLEIAGNTMGRSGPDHYSGSLRLTAPIDPRPEPKIWAMVLVGISLMGIRLRRKIRLAGAQRFA